MFTDALISLCGEEYHLSSHHAANNLPSKKQPEQVYSLYHTESNTKKDERAECDIKNSANKEDLADVNTRNESNSSWGTFINRENFVDMHWG